MQLLGMRNVVFDLGGPRLFDGADLVVEEGERLALVGRNGTGKTTLLRLLTGELSPHEGEIIRRQGLRIARLEQDVPRHLTGNVGDFLREAASADRPEAWRVEARVSEWLSRLGLDPDLDMREVSAGLSRRVLLARALVQEADLLLLDEPTNHLDVDAIGRMEEELLRLRTTLIFVTHDRVFLRRLASGIVDLDRGRLTRYEGDYDRYLERRDAAWASEARERALFEKELAKEEVWIRQGVKERRKRNQGRVQRLLQMRRERAQLRDRAGAVKGSVRETEPSGRLVLRAKGLEFGYGDESLVAGLDLDVFRGDRVGFVGPNGSGKSTLVRLLLGDLEPRGGRLTVGSNVEVARFDQLADSLDPTMRVRDAVADGLETITTAGGNRHVVGYLGDFLFRPEQVQATVSMLSGGEKNRLLLARILAKPCNLLVLDEPTNDLDLETMEFLENLLSEFSGTLLLVSHDREFLDNVVTSCLVFEGDGVVREYGGGYQDAERARRSRLDAAPVVTRPEKVAREKTARPKKLSYKEERELEALPTQIEEFEAEKRSLHLQLADPALYQKKADRVAELRQRLLGVESDLARAYTRWEELELRRDG